MRQPEHQLLVEASERLKLSKIVPDLTEAGFTSHVSAESIFEGLWYGAQGDTGGVSSKDGGGASPADAPAKCERPAPRTIVIDIRCDDDGYVNYESLIWHPNN